MGGKMKRKGIQNSWEREEKKEGNSKATIKKFQEIEKMEHRKRN